MGIHEIRPSRATGWHSSAADAAHLAVRAQLGVVELLHRAGLHILATRAEPARLVDLRVEHGMLTCEHMMACTMNLLTACCGTVVIERG